MNPSDELVTKLKEASEAYYNTGESLLTDPEFDAMVDKLRELDPNHEFLKTVGAPPSGKVVEHKIPMGSQEKLKTKEEFMAWCQKIIDLS